MSASAAKDVLGNLGLGDQVNLPAASLSGGEQQRVAIARVLYRSPPVVFADEPTGALDTDSGRVVMDALRQVAAGGSTLIVVTHDRDVAGQADRVISLRDGLVVTDHAAPVPSDPPGAGSSGAAGGGR